MFGKTLHLIKLALADGPAATDLINSVGAGGFTAGTTPPAATVPVVVTYTAAADTYAAIGTLTIANGGTPTVVELLHYIKELQRQITALQAHDTARGLSL